MRCVAHLLLALTLSHQVVASDAPESLAGLSCSGCHQTGAEQLNLRLLSAAEIEQKLLAFKSGEANATLMTRIARGYSDEELRSLALELGGPDP